MMLAGWYYRSEVLSSYDFWWDIIKGCVGKVGLHILFQCSVETVQNGVFHCAAVKNKGQFWFDLKELIC